LEQMLRCHFRFLVLLYRPLKFLGSTKPQDLLPLIGIGLKFSCLMYRLLNHERDVLQLMDVARAPSGGKKTPVKFIRAKLYLYHYTTATPTDKNYHATNWWWREFERDYFPMISLESTGWMQYLKQTGCLIEKIPRKRKNWLNSFVTFLRDVTNTFQKAEYFIWFLTFVVGVCIILKHKLSKVFVK